MKKETLEEATNNYANYCADYISEEEDLADADKRGFIYGAKWMKERSYSEEDMMDYSNYRLLIKKALSPKEWFEQFKKK